MPKRDWNALQWIAYYYIAFAIFTDREYSDSEKDAFEDTVQTVINKSVKSVGKAINDMEKQIQDHFPDIKYIDLEIN